ncbi:MAG: methylmalonyl-CoA epimerase [Elusimicrobia bacterium]|nr:methylmalonyl-CoA epimerase [Elusimicrobiota bacterium]
MNTHVSVAHIGLAVKNIESSVKLYRDILKLEFRGVEDLPRAKVRVAFFVAGDTKIELLEALAPDSPIAKFIEKNGEGIHHIAFSTDDIEKSLKEIAGEGYTLIDTKPREGAHGSRVAFVHPRSCNGVLIELVQEG